METRKFIAGMVCVFLVIGISRADTFGTGANQFEIEFVTISGDTNPTNGYGIVNNDYRMGKYEITNGQWDKFKAEYGTVTGSPSDAYDNNTNFTGQNVSTTKVSWFEAAQFANWLNISTGQQAAYKFSGTQGTGDYTLSVWESGDAGYNPNNPYRNGNAIYFLPTEDEWVKAAYWNGTTLQEYATKTGESLHQGDGISGTGWNYYHGIYATDPRGPWDVGSGSEEVNGTFDMMGNVWELVESPYYSGVYLPGTARGIRGGSYDSITVPLKSSNRYDFQPYIENFDVGIRIASIPEPATLALLAFGAVILRKSK